MFKTPILLIVFNRPQHAQKVFDQIKKVKPKYLFIAADGPRINYAEDLDKCVATRQIIEHIDWECELKTLFRDENRGCGHGPAEAITWFFEYVENGIILEDDCLPSLSFFPFCEELLMKYSNDASIFMIAGSNAATTWKVRRSHYFFSLMGISYGWATWRRAWTSFDYEIKNWGTKKAKRVLKDHLKKPTYFRIFSAEFDKIFKEKPTDIWDFQWLFARWINNGKTIVPSVNLVSNIGFGDSATHTHQENHQLANLPLMEIKIPLQSYEKIDELHDWYVFERFINPDSVSFSKKIALKMIRIYYNLP